MRMFRITLLFCLAVSLAIAADDPFGGTWVLNKAKSKYTPGPGPEKATVTVTPQGDGAEIKAEVVYEGQTVQTSYTSKYDGTAVPITGSPVADMVSVRKVNDRTLQSRSMKGGKEVGQARVVVAADGKSLTVTGSGLNPKGEKTKFTAVYDKQ